MGIVLDMHFRLMSLRIPAPNIPENNTIKDIARSSSNLLKLSIIKTKIITSSHITSWQINGETMKIVTDFLFLGSKITADGDCSHEIKRHLLLGRKAMTNLDSVLKSKDITLQRSV